MSPRTHPISTLRDAARRYVARQDGASPFYTAIDGLIVLQGRRERHPTNLIHRPALCIVLQGAKWTTFGSRKMVYRAGQALVVSLEMPGSSQIIEGSPADPYLSVIVELDQGALREVIERLGTVPVADKGAPASAFVIALDEPLADCALRAVRLLDTPDAIPIVYPLLMREICYWLVTSAHGGRFAAMTIGNAHDRGVVAAVRVLRENFASPVRIERLAQVARLSPSAFHRKFKEMTSFTPLQYQKQIRLLEARRLMAAGEANVQAAALRVGYESASQFNREYARMFGAPPRRDILRFGAEQSDVVVSSSPLV